MIKKMCYNYTVCNTDTIKYSTAKKLIAFQLKWHVPGGGGK